LKRLFHKSRLYPLVLILVVFVVWKYRESKKPQLILLQGTTMGPIKYTVKYLSSSGENFQPQIDSLLETFNQSLNHYRSGSEVSKFNTDSVFVFVSPYFLPVLQKSREVFEITNGAFDPTVGPLVNAWGFGPGMKITLDSAMVDSLRQLVYFQNIEFDKTKVWKKKKNIQLDFSAIAKGQGVDVVFEFLISRGLENIFVEIGGEVRCAGKNENGGYWKIGIIDPANDPAQEPLYGTVSLENKSMATSGNYYNFIDEGGQRIVHTINPATGYSITSNLLSATVIASDCMTADAFATAFMVLGLEKSISIVENNSELETILIFSNPDGTLAHYHSKGVKGIFVKF
jgi:thiamine biosynthesis lipoprotein